jgi:hypothetical protein
MRAHILALAALVAATVPAAALAQRLDPNVEAQLRMRQAQENLRNYDIQQRQSAQTAQQLDDLDRRVRTQENLDSIRPPPGPTYQPTDTQPVRLVPSVIDLGAQAELLNRELSSQISRNKR